MNKMPFVFRRFFKSKSLRFINLAGLSLMFACIFISYSYIKRETSFDKYHTHSDRIVRMTIAYDGNQPDGRVFGESIKEIWQGIPEIEDELKISKVNAVVLKYKDKKESIDELYFATSNLFDVLDIPLIEGDQKTVLNSPESVAISRQMALRIFGRTNVVGESIDLSSRRFIPTTRAVSGVFENMPENTHFHANIIMASEDFENKYLYYVYFLMKKDYNKATVEKKILDNLLLENKDIQVEVKLMPIGDIHLHSHALREMEPNGNILYIYLLIAINILLFVIVMFNLWLNSNVIFSYNKRYYQLLRLNGASSTILLKDELSVSLLLAGISILVGGLISLLFGRLFVISSNILSVTEICLLGMLFILSVVLVTLLPVLVNISSTLFFNIGTIDLRKSRFSVSNVKYMLIIQYSIVLFIIIVGVGINSQMSLISDTQVGGNDQHLVVLEEQPEEVVGNYIPLRNELLKHPEIEMVTAAMQLPGSAVRDMIIVKKEDNETIPLPVLIVGEDFFPFFGIQPIAGNLFPPLKLSYTEELELLNNSMKYGMKSSIKDNVIINRKAMEALGFKSPADSIGKEIVLQGSSSIDYFPNAVICGVVDNFTYTNVFEASIPMIVLQRNIFMNCFMIKIAPEKYQQSLNVLNSVWNKINPDFPIKYEFLTDSYSVLYKNELEAEKVVNFFSLLSFMITLLGLITFMAFMIRNRTKEIGIRKVNGASNSNIVWMLNWGLLKWTLLSFIIAMPLAWYITNKWLENFAYKASLHWSVYLIGGLLVIAVSFLIVSWQSLRASHINPSESLKGE